MNSLVRRIFSQVGVNGIPSVQPMSAPRGQLFYLNFVYDNSLELKTGQLEFIEYLSTIFIAWDMLQDIIKTGKYKKDDIASLNRLREVYLEDFIKYKHDKLQKI